MSSGFVAYLDEDDVSSANTHGMSACPTVHKTQYVPLNNMIIAVAAITTPPTFLMFENVTSRTGSTSLGIPSASLVDRRVRGKRESLCY